MLRVFKGLPVATEVLRGDALLPSAGSYARDVVTLGWEERLRARSRRVSDSGVDFGTTLPRGTVLRDGDCLVIDELRTVIVVRELAEAVFVVEPQTARDWARFAYAIGNSHQPMALAETSIVCPDVPGMLQVLEYHGIPYTRDLRAFTPVGQTPGHRHALAQ